MKFIRLTSVFLCCALLSLFLILPVSAADDDNYYSLAPVSSSEPSSAGDYSINPAEFSDSDSTVLSSILHFVQFITTSPSSYQPRSIIGMLDRIGSLVFQISKNFGGSAGLATESTLSAISDKVATESSLAKLVSTFSTRIYDIGSTRVDYGQFLYATFGPYSTLFSPNPSRNIGFNNLLSSLGYALTFDGTNLFEGDRTLYSRIRQLQEVLASDDDLAMREDQKENVDQIKQDFISGQSGKTSLGKDDFGSLSSVGGTFKDISSLNGQASLNSFSSGLTDADTAGQGWFSQSTKESLDSVTDSISSSSTISTFSDDGLSSVDVDPDPYNMGNFEDNYSWLWGE